MLPVRRFVIFLAVVAAVFISMKVGSTVNAQSGDIPATKTRVEKPSQLSGSPDSLDVTTSDEGGRIEATCGENFDSVVVPTLPAGWTATTAISAGAPWVTSSAGNPAPASDTAPNSVFVADPATPF